MIQVEVCNLRIKLHFKNNCK